jgi:hypothetical protein
MSRPEDELDPLDCELCGGPVLAVRMRDGSIVDLDPFPYHGLVVLNGKGQGMPATVAYTRHELTCSPDLKLD